MNRARSPVTVLPHPVYGEAPYTPLDGGAPPRGAVRANPDRQNHGQWPPRYFYVDDERVCLDCRKDFVFSANEQRYWYEERGFPFDSVPVRCVPCRRDRRRPVVSGKRLAAATAAARSSPDDAEARLAWARAIVEHHHEVGGGDLSAAVAAARKALALAPGLHECWYWQGRAHESAARPAPAVAAYECFASKTRNTRSRRVRQLREDARRRARALGSGPETD